MGSDDKLSMLLCHVPAVASHGMVIVQLAVHSV